MASSDQKPARSKWRKPIFIAADSSVHGWRVTLMRNPWGSVIGLAALYGNRQACVKWKTWGTP